MKSVFSDALDELLGDDFTKRYSNPISPTGLGYNFSDNLMAHQPDMVYN